MLHGSSLQGSQQGYLDLICFPWHPDDLAIRNLPSSKSRAARNMWPVSQCTLIHSWRIAWLNANSDVQVSFALCAASEQTVCKVLLAQQPELGSWRFYPYGMLRGRSVNIQLLDGYRKMTGVVVFRFGSGRLHRLREEKKIHFFLNWCICRNRLFMRSA